MSGTIARPADPASRAHGSAVTFFRVHEVEEGHQIFPVRQPSLRPLLHQPVTRLADVSAAWRKELEQ